MPTKYESIKVKEITFDKINRLKTFSNFKSISETLEYAIDFYQHRLMRSLNQESLEKMFAKQIDAIKVAKIMNEQLRKQEGANNE